jgi:hypothetical protein
LWNFSNKIEKFFELVELFLGEKLDYSPRATKKILNSLNSYWLEKEKICQKIKGKTLNTLNKHCSIQKK